MGLNLSKSFIIFLIISIILAIGTKNWRIGAVVMALYSVVKIIWMWLTR